MTTPESDGHGTETVRPAARVLFLLNSLCIGGSERKTIRIANELVRRGHVVHVAYLNLPATLLPLLDDKVSVHNLRRSNKFSLSTICRLTRVLYEAAIQVVFCVNLHPLIYVYSAQIIQFRRKVPFIALVNKSKFLPGGRYRVQLLYRHLLNRASRIVFGCQTQQEMWARQFRLRPELCGYIYNPDGDDEPPQAD